MEGTTWTCGTWLRWELFSGAGSGEKFGSNRTAVGE